MSYKKIPYQTCGQILPRYTASDEAKELLDEELSVEQTIQLLQQNQLNNDLVQFLAHALPVREAIWWASLCIQLRIDVWNSTQTQCIQTAQQWVQAPAEDLRRKAELLSNRLELNCGPSWLAQAIFWNGSGSIVAPDLPAVLPDPFLYAKAVAGSINHAAALPNWKGSEEYYTQSLSYALDIANGGNGGKG
ncbi:hypothetical protein OPW41_17770 [Vibrio europaeus]|uniref:Twin-arginine translocation pathway signal n=1 Tax=Vibrio europaeus TaxID=300876 RepID=A0A178JFN1_9VIBR|nr:hypothetical protein [Vibrio europaeus]MDC5707759.1 hypothetical protein [Vibrio europaeus]MDC5710005.1 hypothetical protein [Vibrio europaeus]MDC5715095.1 hypothetical protein [Vibrio europaeus]MDC5722863.1 hypothetical protein [Vibrio europaeus]MDC5726803.1 hypothetical protein [Vibrio europaeus]